MVGEVQFALRFARWEAFVITVIYLKGNEAVVTSF